MKEAKLLCMTQLQDQEQISKSSASKQFLIYCSSTPYNLLHVILFPVIINSFNPHWLSHMQIHRLHSHVQFCPDQTSDQIILRWASTNDKSIPLDGKEIYVLSLFGNFLVRLEQGQVNSAALFICTENQSKYNQ